MSLTYHQFLQRGKKAKMSFVKNFCAVLFLGLFIGAVAFLCYEGYQFCYRVFGSVVVDKNATEDQKFIVELDDTMFDVARRLEQQGLILDRYSFYLKTKLKAPAEVVLSPGEYTLKASMDYDMIINQLTSSSYILNAEKEITPPLWRDPADVLCQWRCS